jgi:hypothetical protein
MIEFLIDAVAMGPGWPRLGLAARMPGQIQEMTPWFQPKAPWMMTA